MIIFIIIPIMRRRNKFCLIIVYKFWFNRKAETNRIWMLLRITKAVKRQDEKNFSTIYCWQLPEKLQFI